jgi:hypothetical protein
MVIEGKTMTTHLVIPDAHAHPDHDNRRADAIGQLIVELKPDVLINLGDTWDMPSLCSYDKNKRSFVHRNYKKDIAAGCDFNERMFAPLKKRKKRKPYSVFLEGNHEERIRRAIDLHPELEGAITYDDLELDRWYDNVVYYNGGTPGVQTIDGICYAHFFVSGVMGRPIGGEHHAYSLLAKHYSSCTAGHSHLLDFALRTQADGSKIMGCVAGACVGYFQEWAGHCNSLWWDGVVIKRNVEKGCYDPQFVSLDSLYNEYL